MYFWVEMFPDLTLKHFFFDPKHKSLNKITGESFFFACFFFLM